MLKNTPSELFFTKNDPLDPRLGEIVNKSSNTSAHTFCIMGAPDERGVIANQGRHGCKQAPNQIRKHFYKSTLFDQACAIKDIGNLELSDSLEMDHLSYAQHVQENLNTGATMILLGGGNDYAFGDILGLYLSSPQRALGAINIDAHLDVRDLRNGITSGTPFYRALEHKPRILDPKNFIEFACQRRVNSAHHISYLKDKETTIHWLDQLHETNIAEAFQKDLELLSLHCESIVVTLDMDAVAQAYAPGVSAPSPNGLSAKVVEKITYMAGQNKHVRVFSIYEVNPLFDRDDQTARLAASCIWNFIDGRLS